MPNIGDNGSAIIYNQVEEGLFIQMRRYSSLEVVAKLSPDATFLCPVLRQKRIINLPHAWKVWFFTWRSVHERGSTVFSRDGPSTRVEALFFCLTNHPQAWKLWLFTRQTVHARGSTVFSLDRPSTRVEALIFYGTEYPHAWKLHN